MLLWLMCYLTFLYLLHTTSCFISFSLLLSVFYVRYVIRPVSCSARMTLYIWTYCYHLNSKNEGGRSMFLWDIGTHGGSKDGESMWFWNIGTHGISRVGGHTFSWNVGTYIPDGMTEGHSIIDTSPSAITLLYLNQEMFPDSWVS